MEVLQQSGRSELEETLKRLQQHKARHAEITEISVNINVKWELRISIIPLSLSSRGAKGVTGVIVVNGNKVDHINRF